MDTNKVTEAVLKGSTPEIMDKVVKFMSTYIFYCWEIEERIFRLSRWFSYNKTIRIMAAIFEMALYYIDLLKDMAGITVLHLYIYILK